MKKINYYILISLLSFALFSSCNDDSESGLWEPAITDIALQSVTYHSALVSARFSKTLSSEPAEVGFIFSTNVDFTDSNYKVKASASDSNSQIYEGSIDSLDAGTTYYYRMYVLNSAGSADTTKSAVSNFTTKLKTTAVLTAPTLVSKSESNIKLSYTITDDGGEDITEHGIVLYTENNPEGIKYSSEDSIEAYPYYGEIDVTNLKDETTYGFSTYAVSKSGTSYSEEYVFNTMKARVFASTYTMKGLSATFTSALRDDISATEVGFEYSKNQDMSDAVNVEATLTSQTFTSELVTLEKNIPYWLRAYANIDGVKVYGDTTYIAAIEVKPFIFLSAKQTNDNIVVATVQGDVDPETLSDATDDFVLYVTNTQTISGTDYENTFTLKSLTLKEGTNNILVFTTNDSDLLYNTDVITIKHIDSQDDLKNVFGFSFESETILAQSNLQVVSDSSMFNPNSDEWFAWDNNMNSAGRSDVVDDPTGTGEKCIRLNCDADVSKAFGTLSQAFTTKRGVYHVSFKFMGASDASFKWTTGTFGNAEYPGGSTSSNFWATGSNKLVKEQQIPKATIWTEFKQDYTIVDSDIKAFWYMNFNGSKGYMYFKDFRIDNAAYRQ